MRVRDFPMKKLLIGTVGVIALGVAPAMAADLPARVYSKASAVVDPVYNWTGFYIGANGGWGSSSKCWDANSLNNGINNILLFVPPLPDGCHNATGGVVGGQVGYRWQSAAWVFGLEAQGDWANLSGSNLSLLRGISTNRSKIDGLGLFTGQVGYAWKNALLYVKGGAAVARDEYDLLLVDTGLSVAAANETRWGGVVGVGLEYGFAQNWSAAIEYDHEFMGDRTLDFYSTTVPGQFTREDRIRQDVDMVTARINYRWGSPVVAKYSTFFSAPNRKPRLSPGLLRGWYIRYNSGP